MFSDAELDAMGMRVKPKGPGLEGRPNNLSGRPDHGALGAEYRFPAKKPQK